MPTSGVLRKRLGKGEKLIQPAKARKILRHGKVRGHKLSKAQRGFFGARV